LFRIIFYFGKLGDKHHEEEMKNLQFIFKIIFILILALSLLALFGCGDDDDDDNNDSPDDDDNDDDDDDDDAGNPALPTTLDITFVPIEISSGTWEIIESEGEPHFLRNDLWVEATRSPGNLKPLSISYFMAVSDTHITDEESPTRLTFFDSNEVLMGLFEAAFRPQEDLAPQILNSVIRTANRIQADYKRDFDFALILGDVTDNAQANELKTFVDIIEGSKTTSGIDGFARVDSGDLEIDPGSGLNNGERDFEIQELDNFGSNINAFNRPGYPNSNADIPVEGLKKSSGASVPWFFTMGNHDAFNTGNFDPDSPLTFYSRDDYTGDLSPFGYIPGIASAIEYWEENPGAPLHIDGGLFGWIKDWTIIIGLLDTLDLLGDYMRDYDPRFDLMTLINNTPNNGSDDGVVIAGDPEREFYGLKGMQSLIYSLESGFADNNNDTKVDPSDGGWYVADLAGKFPVRLLVLDTTDVPLASSGRMSQEQLDWFESELNRAVKDQVLVMVMSHHYSDSIESGRERFINLIKGCPNVFIHLVGHGHHNKVIPHRAPIDVEPAYGYWEVECPSTIEFPQQWRIFEIVDNRDGTGTVFVTNVDHFSTLSDDSDTLAALGYNLGFSDILPDQGYDQTASVGGRGSFTDRNVGLKFAIPLEIANNLASYESDGVIISTDVLGTKY